MPTILVIDDSQFICTVIKNVFADTDVEVITVGTAIEGVEKVLHVLPDLVLMDVSLPDLDGFSACIALKSAKETMEIPVVFITGHDHEEDILCGFESGAVDYISKPFNATELKARINAHLKLKLMSDDMKLLNENLSKALEENRRLAETDPLTGLYNRRYGWEYMESYRTSPEHKPSVLLMGDIDNFKLINDRYGHNVGDTVLCSFFKAIQDAVKMDGAAFRWGGEEVLIILHGYTPTDVLKYGTHICKSLNKILFKSQDEEFNCSITLGVAGFDFKKPIEYSISLADDALYEGKKMGKNRCMIMSTQ